MPIDTTTAPKPPRKRVTKTKVSVPNPEIAAREEAVAGLFQIAGAGCVMFGQLADAEACADYGPKISKELAEISDQNESLAKVLDYLTAAGPWAGLLVTVLPFGLQIMVNHGRLPAAPLAGLGIKDPQILQAKMIRDAAEQQAAFEREVQAGIERERLDDLEAASV